jgi:hypothetical protein
LKPAPVTTDITVRDPAVVDLLVAAYEDPLVGPALRRGVEARHDLVVAHLVFAEKTWPVALMDKVMGLASTLRGAAEVFGRSRGTPPLMSGAATMKMMRSTSMTSMNGVMLISLIARRAAASAAAPAGSVVHA